MKFNHLQGIGLLLIVLALAMLACNVPELGPTVPETAVPVEATTETAEVVEENVETAEETELVDPQVKAITNALLERFDEDSAFVAVAAAMERGYSFDQIETGALAARLEANGYITAEDGIQLSPASEEVGVLDLSDLQAKVSNMSKVQRLQEKPSNPLELLNFFRELYSPGDDIADESILVYLLLQLQKNGYTIEQIVLGVVSGDAVTFRFQKPTIAGIQEECVGLRDVNGKYIRPDVENIFSSPCINLFEDEEEETTETEEAETETASETEEEMSEPLTAMLTIDDYQVDRKNCIQEQQGHTFQLHCDFDIIMEISYEVPKTPAYLYCEPQNEGAGSRGGPNMTLNDLSGTVSMTVQQNDVWGLYKDENENGAADPPDADDALDRVPDNDGIFIALKCGVSEFEFESRVTFFLTSWAETICPHPENDVPGTNCIGPWLSLAEAHAWD